MDYADIFEEVTLFANARQSIGHFRSLLIFITFRQHGKTYVVEDGDIIFFKFNAGAGLTAGKKK